MLSGGVIKTMLIGIWNSSWCCSVAAHPCAGNAGLDDWMGWSFSLGHKPTTGVSFWDIRFKGERIIYELSLQVGVAGQSASAVLVSDTVLFMCTLRLLSTSDHDHSHSQYHGLRESMSCTTAKTYMMHMMVVVMWPWCTTACVGAIGTHHRTSI